MALLVRTTLGWRKRWPTTKANGLAQALSPHGLSGLGALPKLSHEPPESPAPTMSFRTRLIRALVIWSGAFAIGAVFAAIQNQFGCVFFQRGGSMIVALGLLIGFAAERARRTVGRRRSPAPRLARWRSRSR